MSPGAPMLLSFSKPDSGYMSKSIVKHQSHFSPDSQIKGDESHLSPLVPLRESIFIFKKLLVDFTLKATEHDKQWWKGLKMLVKILSDPSTQYKFFAPQFFVNRSAWETEAANQEQWFSKCGHQTCSCCSTWALVRNASPWAPPQTYWTWHSRWRRCWQFML